VLFSGYYQLFQFDFLTESGISGSLKFDWESMWSIMIYSLALINQSIYSINIFTTKTIQHRLPPEARLPGEEQKMKYKY